MSQRKSIATLLGVAFTWLAIFAVIAIVLGLLWLGVDKVWSAIL